ncbi:DUF6880 family protein [Phenylobacterium sp.]|jgi:hypothetical protein|uniref:DUF6880 family protein n=1 Tax=Phenylobacterium sp. TaxID=1871053 RepID=UPI002F92C8DF
MAKKPTVASLKKVTPENLARLGPERLAELLAAAAQNRPELKRRLRMELAAEQGVEHLTLEIDKRLGSLQGSGGRVSWRQRGAFVRDLEGLRGLIAGRLAGLDGEAARERLFVFLGVAPRVRTRVRDKDGGIAAVFARAAGDLSGLVQADDAGRLADAIAASPGDWAAWLPAVLEGAPAELAEAVLTRLSARPGASATWMGPLRRLADAAGNVDAYRATWTAAALKTPEAAAEVGRRLLTAGRVEEAGEVLKAAAPKGKLLGRATPDFGWESVWIDWLEGSGQAQPAQDARWASFERTLSVERAKAFVSRLTGFDDVEAEEKVFALAAGHADFAAGLRLLMDWPALPEAARMIRARADEAGVAAELAELWAGRLRARFPEAANVLLRKAAAAAFRRREFAACDRLTAEADSIGA